MRRGRSTFGVLLVLLASLWVITARVGLYRARLGAGRLSVAFPDRLLPRHVSVLPPPAAEYVGVWEVPPAEARSRLRAEFGFSQLFRAYLHGYERDGRTVHEVGSYVYRPNGLVGPNQLHVRLFPTDDGHTELWAHWESNPNRSPISHLKKIGYDTEEGQRRLRAMLADEPLRTPDSDSRPDFVS